MNSLKLLSGGAAHGLVASVTPQFTAQTGWTIDGDYGAVGIMARRLRDGAPVDLMILTAALIADLQRERLLRTGSVRAIGAVETAIAVRNGDERPSIGDETALRDTLLTADAIFVPDIVASTAGAHVAKVLHRLGIFERVRERLKILPNGATAMRELAVSTARRPVGCTQSTEIIVTPGLTLVGSLPPPCALVTVYTAAVTTEAADCAIAETLIDILVGSDQLAARQHAGFIS